MDSKQRHRFDRQIRPRGMTSDGTPHWWRGEAEAAQGGLALARAFGFNPTAMIERAKAGG